MSRVSDGQRRAVSLDIRTPRADEIVRRRLSGRCVSILGSWVEWPVSENVCGLLHPRMAQRNTLAQRGATKNQPASGMVAG